MTKTAKFAIVCAVVFFVSLFASIAFFVAAAPEIKQHSRVLEERVESWAEQFKNKFHIKGDIAWNFEDDRFTFYVDEDERDIPVAPPPVSSSPGLPE